ncbi:F-box protein SKIP28 [Camellia lanceoleosa]|uniref:F-box protein SKIP28 n=1 Tax=Camellia lanceoleosa TaxID=1840588 RepID=A0ACC0FX57_9ERIC|nr:F-box protein SKIP28 [Camellia lanceoleosa]
MEISDNKKGHEVHNSMPIKPPPHEALFLALSYLPLFELLAMSGVCKSLRDAVNNDILPWLNITVKQPLNSRLSDHILMRIASKANGRLRTLALINCVMITDDGLQQVIENNPHITKLHVPACTGLTPDGVIRAVKTLTDHSPNLISLKIAGIYDINKHHVEILHSILNTNLKRHNPQIQHEHKRFTRHQETDCPIDIDICPKCDQANMVFDCPRKSCAQKRKEGRSECRGCYCCIMRCVQCGKCVEYEEPVEAVCLHALCLDCWLQLPKCCFCNRPYCNQHADEPDQKFSLLGSSGFICAVCHEMYIENARDF